MSLPWSAELCAVVNEGEDASYRLGGPLVSSALLRGLLRVPSDAELMLRSHGVREDAFNEAGYGEDASVVQRVYDRAMKIAMSAREDEVKPLHLLHALIEDYRSIASVLLRHQGVDLEALRAMIFGHVATHQAHQLSTVLQRGQHREVQASLFARPAEHSPLQIGLHPALADLSQLGQGHSGSERWEQECEVVTGAFPVVRPQDQVSADYAIIEAGPSPASYSAPRPAAPATPEQPLLVSWPEELPHQTDLNRGAMVRRRSGLDRPKTSPGMRRPHVNPSEAPQNKREPSNPRLRAPKMTARESQESTLNDLAQRLVAKKKKDDAQKRPTIVPSTSQQRPQPRPQQRVMNQAPARDSRASLSRTSRSPLGFDRFGLNPKVFPVLVKYGRNLLAEAREGRLDPVIGRDGEVEQLIDILNKRRSNNPVLIGAAGVGKTAIIEGLARLMAQREPPPGLEDRTLISLDMGTLLCGTQLRGAFQERLMAIKTEVRKAQGQVILFLDELHTWLGNGAGDAGTDAAGELKVALARGELPCIGATTTQEFKRIVDNDPAFDRRFEVIEVKPPSICDSITIIKGIIDRYGDHHHINYQPDAIEAAVRLSDRYVRERTLPDKAVAVLDRAGSMARRAGKRVVQREDVAEVISRMASVPLERLLMGDRERFLCMEKLLGEKLVGHEESIARIAQVIRRNHAGFGSHRPIGSFLFLGPTGVGKTEAVKVLADFLFGARSAVVRFDMSEYMEQHAVARLIGPPPGYVGFDDGGQLTEALRRHPHQIVLLDEIEKAHPDLLNILLQILDEGRLTDSKGRVVDFSNCVVVMTSNLGAAEAMREGRRGTIGFSDGASHDLKQRHASIEKTIVEAARRAFPPELWNRIEERLVFHPLEEEEVAKIAELQLADSAQRLDQEKNIQLDFDASVVPFLIARGGYDPQYGARPMRKTIQQYIEAALSELILRDRLLPGDFARVYVEDEVVKVDRTEGLTLGAA